MPATKETAADRQGGEVWVNIIARTGSFMIDLDASLTGMQHLTDGAAVAELLRGPSGIVARFIQERATVVQAAAKQQVGVRSGRLRGNIVKRNINVDGEFGCKVGTEAVPYALWHHEGTEPHDIPNAFGWGPTFGIGGRFDGKFHPGTKPNPYLTDNLHLACE